MGGSCVPVVSTSQHGAIPLSELPLQLFLVCIQQLMHCISSHDTPGISNTDHVKHVYSELTFTLSIMFLTGLRTLGPEVNHYGWLPMGMFPITKISCN